MQSLPAARELSNRAKHIYFAWGTKGNSQIRSYPATADGDVAPKTVIAGSNTKLDVPFPAYVTPTGAIFTCNLFGRILGFSAGAHGDVPPIRDIGGPLRVCRSVAMHAGIVATADTNYARSAVLVWGPRASGEVKPTRTISGKATKLHEPYDVAFDSGGAIYVANYSGDSITVYARDANGNANPLRRIFGGLTGLRSPSALAVDNNAGLLYVANSGRNAITAYRLSQSGSVKPAALLAGSDTLLSSLDAVAVDGAGYVYAGNRIGGKGYITVYAPGSQGNVKPVQVIKGDKVDLRGHIAVK